MVSAMANSDASKMAQEEKLERILEGGAKTGGGVTMKGGAQEEELSETTMDGSVDTRGHPAPKGRSGGWVAGILVLGLATLAFFGVGCQPCAVSNEGAAAEQTANGANNVSKWTGTVYIFSLVGAFLSDSYWGRYQTCAVFQIIFVFGLVLLSMSSHMLLLKPSGCGDGHTPCGPHSRFEVWVFYLSIYLVALGNGGYQPNIATFGADQFEEGDPKEGKSKVAFFSYFYLALNLGSLFSNTILSYFEDQGMWALSFWASAGSAAAALALFLAGTPRYRHFRPGGNPVARVSQVVVAASRNWRAQMPPGGEELYEVGGKEFAAAGGSSSRKMLHTDGLKFLDRAAFVGTEEDFIVLYQGKDQTAVPPRDPWRVCTITQVEEVKCVLRLLPIWLCTLIYSVVFTQMASLFVVQGAAMNAALPATAFRIPPASMSAFDILSVAACILLYRRAIHPLACRLTADPRGPTELQRMGAGLAVAIAAMASAGTVEHFRLRHAARDGSSLSILWQVPQYVLIGASEVFMYVGQLEFFNGQAPDGLKSFGSALCMTSMSLGNYVSDLLVTVVMEITARGKRPGWIPADLNEGHMDRFYFLLAAMTAADLVVYVACAKWYKPIKLEGRCGEEEEEEGGPFV